MSGYQYYLFDLDGTLTDPGIGITNSVMYALNQYGIHVKERRELYRFIGPPLVDSFMEYYGFSKEQALEAVEHYRVYFRSGGIFENSVYDGVVPMLEELKKSGAKLCLATSKPEEFAIQILRHFDLFSFFDYIGAATMDGRISRKQDVIAHLLDQLPSKDRRGMLMVGDRSMDIFGAKACRIDSAGVLWGYGTREELRQAGAEYIAADPADIPAFGGQVLLESQT